MMTKNSKGVSFFSCGLLLKMWKWWHFEKVKEEPTVECGIWQSKWSGRVDDCSLMAAARGCVDPLRKNTKTPTKRWWRLSSYRFGSIKSLGLSMKKKHTHKKNKQASRTLLYLYRISNVYEASDGQTFFFSRIIHWARLVVMWANLVMWANESEACEDFQGYVHLRKCPSLCWAFSFFPSFSKSVLSVSTNDLLIQDEGWFNFRWFLNSFESFRARNCMPSRSPLRKCKQTLP